MVDLSGITRVLSRPVAKPYRNKHMKDEETHINDNGHLDFAPGDIENPKNWSKLRRWIITMIAVLLVINATFASSSPSGALDGPNGIAEYFHVSTEVSGLVITVFLLGYCAGPFIFAPLSEFYGRRYVMYGSFLGYFAFNFLCAWPPNFASLLVARFLTGTFASSPLANVPGILVDLWDPIERGNAMAIFSMMTFVGPALGPVISGFLELKETWRWNFFVLLWFAAGTIILMLTIPETYAPAILLRKAKRIRSKNIPGFENVQTELEASGKSLWSTFKVALSRPWKIITDPISLLIAIYIAFVYALLYMLFSIYPIIFQQKRGWNAGVGELPLIGTAIGAVIGAGMIFVQSAHDRKKQEAGYKSVPEDRLVLAMVGAVLFPITMFWFAWTGNYNSIHWISPAIAGVFLSTSILLIFVALFNYLADAYLMYTASAVAANTVFRSAAGAAAPLFTNYMFDALGVGGGGSLIGGVAVLLAPIPFVFYKKGAAIRKRSKYAPTDDDKPPTKNEEAAPQAEGQGEEESSSTGSSVTAHGGADASGEVLDEERKEKARNERLSSESRSPKTKKENVDVEKGLFMPIGGLE